MKFLVFIVFAMSAFAAPAKSGDIRLAKNEVSLQGKKGSNFAARSFHFLKDHSVEVGVELPLNFGVHGSVHFNKESYFRLGAGFASEYFLGTFARLAPHFNYISQGEAELIVDIIKDSLYLDTRLGWVPYGKKHAAGPYMELGLSGMLFGKGKTDGLTLKNALNVGETTGKYSVKSNVDNASFHAGYQIPFEKNLKLNVDVGVVKILHVNPIEKKSVELQALSKEDYGKLQDLLVKKGWIFPTVSLWLSFAF